MTGSQRVATAAVLLAVAVVVAGVVGLVGVSGPSTRTISADFPTTPGLYRGNHVDVLGIPVGTVTSITPTPTGVVVRMRVERSVAIPAAARALLEAPDVVNDRFVELAPAYTGGPRLPAGGVIPISRTAVPVSTNAILQNLDQLVVDLGPTAANRNGALSQVIAELAHFLGGNGPALNRTINSTGSALAAVGRTAPQLQQLLGRLATFTRAAAANSGQYQQFIQDLGAVSTELAADNADLGSALHELQTSFAALSGFLAANRGALGGTVAHLDTLFATLAAEQKQLAGLIGIAPTALDNVANAINPNAPGGPALNSRYDPTTGAASLTKQVCGNTLLRLLVLTVQHPAKATPLDVVCGFSSLIENLGTPPGAPAGAASSLSALVGHG